ncbi:MAG: tRNA dihydrouridine synthase DusB [Oscillospiraceae bacterium]|nr:tRNA dihydrouridine synthase DusB [Oscillospiraceae bacterium]
MEYINIGNVRIKKTAALAPIADVGDTAFRITSKMFGAAYTVGEMTSCKGLVYGDRKTTELPHISESERSFDSPSGIQLFGSEPDSIARATEMSLEYKPDIIDINAGCPVNKVVSTGAGSALMKEPRLFFAIVRSAVKAASKVPVTVKIRSGWNSEQINAVEIAKLAEEAGASAITVHGRTRVQMYSGKADQDIIAQVKQTVKIPVIANGDVDSAESCMEMYRKTGCDLVMLARASFGKPWIFREIENGMQGIPFEPPTLPQKLDIMREHIRLATKLKGERIAMRESRKLAAWYIKGIRNAAMFRNACMGLETLNDLERLIGFIKEQQMS